VTPGFEGLVLHIPQSLHESFLLFPGPADGIPRVTEEKDPKAAGVMAGDLESCGKVDSSSNELVMLTIIIRYPWVYAPNLDAVLALHQNPTKAVVQVKPQNTTVFCKFIYPPGSYKLMPSPELNEFSPPQFRPVNDRVRIDPRDGRQRRCGRSRIFQVTHGLLFSIVPCPSCVGFCHRILFPFGTLVKCSGHLEPRRAGPVRGLFRTVARPESLQTLLCVEHHSPSRS
jgi:hypothetical protein